jgi:hypothetical protein
MYETASFAELSARPHRNHPVFFAHHQPKVEPDFAWHPRTMALFPATKSGIAVDSEFDLRIPISVK